MAEPTLSELAARLTDLESRVARMDSQTDSRLARVETKLGLEPVPSPSPVPKPVPPVSPPVEPAPLPRPVPAPVPAPVPKPVPTPTPPAPAEPWQFPKIDLVWWMLRAGVASLVIGLALLVAYSYAYIGPWAKLATGFVAAAALVVGGEVLTRKRNGGWIGMSLAGGGWALAYFTIFAMANIASVRVIDALPDVALLLTTAAAAMAHATQRRSEAIAALATVLGYVTISLSPLTGFSILATALLVLGSTVLVSRMRWHVVYVLSTAAGYVTYVFVTGPQIAQSNPAALTALSFGFLSVFWLAANYLSLSLAAAGDYLRRYVVPGVFVANAAAYILLNLLAASPEFVGLRWAFLAVVGVVYLGLAWFSRKAGHKDLAFAASLIGLQGLTVAVPLKLDGSAMAIAWALELPLLVAIGLRAKLVSFRLFGVLLAAAVFVNFLTVTLAAGATVATVAGIALSERLLTGAFTVLALALTAVSYARNERTLSELERPSGFLLYGAGAAAMTWLLISAEASVSVAPLLWLFEAALLLAVGLWRGDIKVHGAAVLVAASAVVSLVGHYQVIGLPVELTVVGALAAFGATYRLASSRAKVDFGLEISQVYTLAAFALGALLTGLQNTGPELATYLALQGVALLALGFLLKDQLLRTASAVFAVGIAGTLFYTLSSWSWATVLPVVAILYAVGFAYRFLWPSNSGGEDSQLAFSWGLVEEKECFHRGGTLGATLLLSLAFLQLLEWQLLAVAWGLEGLVLMVLAYALRDKVLRGFGIAVFVAVAGKLLFYDLRAAESIERILSFIVGGIVLVVSAVVDKHFSKRMEQPSVAVKKD